MLWEVMALLRFAILILCVAAILFDAVRLFKTTDSARAVIAALAYSRIILK